MPESSSSFPRTVHSFLVPTLFYPTSTPLYRQADPCSAQSSFPSDIVSVVACIRSTQHLSVDLSQHKFRRIIVFVILNEK